MDNIEGAGLDEAIDNNMNGLINLVNNLDFFISVKNYKKAQQEALLILDRAQQINSRLAIKDNEDSL